MNRLRHPLAWRGSLRGLRTFALGLLLAAGSALAQTPTVTSVKAFTPAIIASGGVSLLTIDLVNNSTSFDATAVAFTDTLPAPLVFVGAATADCDIGLAISGATLTATGGIVTADGGKCHISVQVSGLTDRDVTVQNTTGVLTCAYADATCTGTTASARLTIRAGAPLAIVTAPPLAPPLPFGVTFSQALAATGGTPPYQWDVAAGSLPAGLSLAPGGTLSGTPTAVGTFTFTARVRDAVGTLATRAFDLAVVAPPVAIVTAPPLAPPLAFGGSFTATLVATGGTPPYQWDLVNDGLPPGLALSPGGTIAGAPSAVGTFTFTARVRDTLNSVATRIFDLTVNVAPLQITTPSPLTPPLAPGGRVDVLLEAIGGLPPYQWSLGGGQLPPGVTLGGDGRLSGAPQQAGSFGFDARVTDARGTVTTHNYTLVIVNVAGAFTLQAQPNPAVSGQPVTLTATVSGGGAAATGSVDAWIAGGSARCPTDFGVGTPSAPEAAKRTAALDANGRATFTLANLAIDDYQVCARYAGDKLYAGAKAGPLALAVIKGVILGAPQVALSAPAAVSPGATLTVQVAVSLPETPLAPAGTVRLTDGARDLGSAALAGGYASLQVEAPATGRMTVVAEYGGDGVFSPAVSPALTVVVTKDALTAIPTLSEMALVLLVLLLGGAAAVRLAGRPSALRAPGRFAAWGGPARRTGRPSALRAPGRFAAWGGPARRTGQPSALRTRRSRR